MRTAHGAELEGHRYAWVTLTDLIEEIMGNPAVIPTRPTRGLKNGSE